MYDSNFLDNLQASVPLSSVVSKRVSLQKSGPFSFKGLCPFHTEKTPSFSVNDQKGVYYCFGCEAKGNIFTFLVEGEKKTFKEAVEMVCSMAGISPPQWSRRDKQEHAPLLEVLEQACQFFERTLLSEDGSKVRAYLEGRGYPSSLWETFRLGCAPLWGFLSHMKSRFSLDLLEKAGLCRRTDRETYPFFHGRLMFPILSPSGVVVGFGGRFISLRGGGGGQEKIKYLNSPESPVFSKSSLLFNYKKALENKPLTVFIVEGYTDVLSLYNRGVCNSVATLGTALTKTHLFLLWRRLEKITICFDGDRAGRAASERAAMLALPFVSPGREIVFIQLPENEDPDSVLKSHGEDFSHRFHALSLSDFLWQSVWEKVSSAREISPEMLAKIEETLLGYGREIQHQSTSKIYQERFRNKLYQVRRHNTLPFSTQHMLKRRKTLLSVAHNLGKSTADAKVLLGFIITTSSLLIQHAACLTASKTLLEKMILYDPPLDRLRKCLLKWISCFEQGQQSELKEILLRFSCHTMASVLKEQQSVQHMARSLKTVPSSEVPKAFVSFLSLNH